MSPQEKLDLAQRSYAAFSAGPDVEAILPLYDHACEWRMGYIEAAFGSLHGHEGLREFADQLANGFAHFRCEIAEARITDDGRLLIRGNNYAESAVTGMELDMLLWQEITFRDGRILRVIQTEGPPTDWDAAKKIT